MQGKKQTNQIAQIYRFRSSEDRVESKLVFFPLFHVLVEDKMHVEADLHPH